MSSPASRRTDTLAVQTSPTIDRPGEIVVLDKDHAGRIRCKQLVVLSGVRAEVLVRAEQVNIAGEVTGIIKAETITIATDGTFVGQCMASRINVAGRINGLLHARVVIARAGAMMEGEIVADRVERQPTTFLVANVVVGPGMSNRKDLVSKARRRLGMEPVTAEVSAASYLQAVPAKPKLNTTDPDASFRRAPAMPLMKSAPAIPYLIRN